jgi:2-hydroxy-6-oxonona-2,4-dienedioate hydrolase
MSERLPELAVESVETRFGRMHARAARHAAPAYPLPIVLVHGFVVSSSYMVPTARWLARRHTVLAPDLPGFGESDDPEGVLDVAGLADALAAWMAAAGVPRAVLLGNSLGCQVVTDVAVRYPALVDRAVLVGPTIDPAHRTRASQVFRLLVDAFREKPALWLTHLGDWPDAGVRRAWQTFEHMMADQIEARLPQVGQPVLVVRGARDPIVPAEWAEHVARLLPDARLCVIPAAAHAVNFDAPRRLARVVEAYLRLAGPRAAG